MLLLVLMQMMQLLLLLLQRTDQHIGAAARRSAAGMVVLRHVLVVQRMAAHAGRVAVLVEHIAGGRVPGRVTLLCVKAISLANSAAK